MMGFLVFFLLLVIIIVICLNYKTGGANKKTHRLAEEYKKNIKLLTQFLTYITYRFQFKQKNILEDLLDLTKKGKSDEELFDFMRKNINMNSKFIIDHTTKISNLDEIIPSKNEIRTILDVGTEDVAFLDSLESVFAAQISGINIDAGFCHYNSEYLKNMADKRFKLYDGKNIPFPKASMDLVTIYSVLHHISDEDLPAFIEQLRRVVRRYVFIKEHDLCNETAVNFYDIQHELFEGALVGNKTSYRSITLSYKKLLGYFEDNGFSLVKHKPLNNFSNAYYALFIFGSKKYRLAVEYKKIQKC